MGLLGKAFYKGKGEALSLHIKAMNSHGITWLQRPNGSHPRLAQFTDQNKVFQVAQPAPKDQPETSSLPAPSLILPRNTTATGSRAGTQLDASLSYWLCRADSNRNLYLSVYYTDVSEKKKKITGNRDRDGVRAVFQTASAC